MQLPVHRLWLAGWATLTICSVHPSPTFAQSAALEIPGLRGYIEQVLRENAGLRASDARLGAAGQQIAPAGALPDPTVTVGAMSVPVTSFDVDREAMTQFPILFQQRFPFPGKRGAATRVARADSALASADRRLFEVRLAQTAVHAYFTLASARTALDIWRGRVALADQAIAIAQVRYATGVAPQTDILRARLRRAELVEQRMRLEAAVIGSESRLDALRAGQQGRVSTPQLISPATLSRVRGDSMPSSAFLRQTLIRRSPGLRTAQAKIDRAQRAVDAFSIAGRPDFTVGLQGAARGGGREPFVTALVGISLPLYAGRKQRPVTEAARLTANAAQEEYHDLLTRLNTEVDVTVVDLTSLRDRVLLTADEILPLAEAASASALQRYKVGALEFSTVLTAQDDLFGAQLRLAQLLADYSTTWADLTALIGREWYR